MAEVKLIMRGTSVKHCSSENNIECNKCGSWIDHWEKYTYKSIKNCCLCGKKSEVGSHITIVESDNKKWIIPTCDACNDSSGIAETICDVYAVSAMHYS